MTGLGNFLHYPLGSFKKIISQLNEGFLFICKVVQIDNSGVIAICINDANGRKDKLNDLLFFERALLILLDIHIHQIHRYLLLLSSFVKIHFFLNTHQILDITLLIFLEKCYLLLLK